MARSKHLSLNSVKRRVSRKRDNSQVDQPKIVRRFSTIGGLIALALAIASGFYSWYGILIVNREKLIEDRRSELSSLIGRLAQIDQRMIEREEYENSQRELSFLGSIDTEKRILLLRSEEIIEELGAEHSSYALQFVSGQYSAIGEFDSALRYAKMVLDAPVSTWQRSDAHLTIASIAFAEPELAKDEDADKHYRSSVELFFPLTSGRSANQASRAYLQWNNRLLQLGQCDEAAKVAAESMQRLSGVAPTPMFNFVVFESYLRGNYQNQVMCSFP